MNSPLFWLAGGGFAAALLRNRGRSRAILSRLLEKRLRRKHEALLAGTLRPALSATVSPYAISLTSWRPRLPVLPLTLLTLLEQSLRPAAIYVWLTPADASLLSPDIRAVYESFGVEFTLADDLGPHKKWLPMLESGATTPFVICDDDSIYPRHWFAALVGEDRLDCYVGCKCHRMTRTSQAAVAPYDTWPKQIAWDGRPAHAVFVTGVGGAVLHPARIAKPFRDRQVLLRICPRADDVWLKVAHFQAGVPCFKTRYSFPCLEFPGTEQSGLAAANVTRHGNDQQLAATLKHFELNAAALIEPAATTV